MIFENIKPLLKSEKILKILAESVYNPTAERLNTRAEKYTQNGNVTAFGAKIDSKFCGIIILEQKNEKETEILDIAVSKNIQKTGIGSSLIKYSLENLKPQTLIAETDDDAVLFYKKLGFKVELLGECRGVMRYKCVLNK